VTFERREFDEAVIVSRCENWGRSCRAGAELGSGTADSFEGRYTSPQRGHWEPPPLGALSAAFDRSDSLEVDAAWQSLGDVFHQVVLGAWYVRKWSPAKCDGVARKSADYPKRRVDLTDAEWLRILRVGHGLLWEQLGIPAVIRRDRLIARVRQALADGDAEPE
jgi:hypothetical protein